MTTALEKAIALDKSDQLHVFRSEFLIPKDEKGQEKIYFCGNSLGLQPKQTRKYVEQVLTDWEKFAVEGHSKANPPWMPYHEFLTEQMARVVGANPIEVVVMNSLSVNIHLMMVSFYRPSSTRYKILIEKPAFPSDRYAVVSQINFHGFDPQLALIELEPDPDTGYIHPENISKIIEEQGNEIALIWLGNVNYYSGQAFDMKRTAAEGNQKGCIVGFDLAHGAGNLDCNLHESGIDFACWCTYKYLNSGPGGMSGIFVHERHANRPDLPRFAGWWGHNKSRRFKMEPDFDLLPGAEGWQLSNPPILPMAALLSSLDIFDRAGISSLVNRRKSLGTLLLKELNELNSDYLSVITPQNEEERGAQISIQVKNKNKDLFNYLSAKGVIADWREPDVIRVAPTPLYNTHEEIVRFVGHIRSFLEK